jgi:hypothetical protein
MSTARALSTCLWPRRCRNGPGETPVPPPDQTPLCPETRQCIASQRDDVMCQSRHAASHPIMPSARASSGAGPLCLVASQSGFSRASKACSLATYRKFPEEAVTSVSDNSSQDDRGGARDHGKGNKRCDERHGPDRLSRKPRRHTAIGAFLCSAITKSGGIVIRL